MVCRQTDEALGWDAVNETRWRSSCGVRRVVNAQQSFPDLRGQQLEVRVCWVLSRQQQAKGNE